MIKQIIFILKNSINFQNFKIIKIISKIIIKYPSKKVKIISFWALQTILSGSPPYPPSCPLSIIKNKKIPSFNQQRWKRWERWEIHNIPMTAIKGRASRGPIPPTCRWVGCHTLLLTPAKPPFPKTIITRTDRNFSIVPKYLAFLRSNSGQEKLEKESLRLL